MSTLRNETVFSLVVIEYVRLQHLTLISLSSAPACSLDGGDIEVAVPSFVQVREARDSCAGILDLAAIVAPLDGHFYANLRSVQVDAAHGEHFTEVIAVDRA